MSQRMSKTYANNGNAVDIQRVEGPVSISNEIYTSTADSGTKAISFRFKYSQANFTGRSVELSFLEAALINSQNNPTQLPSIAVVFGLGGIGKTQLVRKFITKNHKSYKNVIWINAESSSSMIDDIENLAKNYLKIFTKVRGKDKDVQYLTEEVFHKLSASSTVIVFDNVDETKNSEIIRIALTVGTSGIRPHVILTSRIQEWSASIHHIKLSVFNVEDAREHVSKKLSDPDRLHNDSIEDIMKLIEMLQYFPLALTQAISHINHHRVVKVFYINDYLREYTQEKILGSNFFQNDDCNLYDKTTLTTWNVTIAAIKTFGRTGELALRILRIIAYFNPNHIRRDIFFNLEIPITEQEMNIETAVTSAVRLLVNYSMVDSQKQQSLLSIHRLVQQVTRIEVENDAELKQTILRDSLDVISKMEKHPQFKECFDHGISTFSAALTCNELVREYSTFPTTIILGLNNYGKFIRAINFGEKMFQQLTAILEENHIDALKCKFSAGISYAGLGKYDEALRMYNDVFEKIKSILEEDDQVLDYQLDIASVYDRMGKFAQAIPMIEDVYEKRMKSLGEDHPQTLISKANMGTVYNYLGQYSDALRTHQEVFEKRKKILGENDPRTINSMSHIADTYNDLGMYFQSLEMYLAVFEKRKIILSEDHPRTLTSESYVAEQYNNLGEYSKALQKHLTVFEKRKLMLVEDHLKTLDSMTYIAITFSKLGKHFQAIDTLQEVGEKLNTMLGEEHQKTLYNMSNIAAANSNIRKHFVALQMHRKVFEKWKKKLRENHPHTMIVHFNFAVSYSCVGNHCTAVQMHQEVFQKRLAILGEDHPHTLDSKFRIAISLNAKGQHILALQMHLEVYEKRKTKLGENHPDTLNSKSNIANSYSNIGELSEALELHQDVFAKRKTLLGDNHPHTLTSMSNIAAVYSFLGDYSEALRMYEEIYEKCKTIFGNDHPETIQSELLIRLCKRDKRAKCTVRRFLAIYTA